MLQFPRKEEGRNGKGERKGKKRKKRKKRKRKATKKRKRKRRKKRKRKRRKKKGGKRKKQRGKERDCIWQYGRGRNKDKRWECFAKEFCVIINLK